MGPDVGRFFTGQILLWHRAAPGGLASDIQTDKQTDTGNNPPPHCVGGNLTSWWCYGVGTCVHGCRLGCMGNY